MKAFRFAAVLALGLLAGACGQEKSASLPPPHEPGPDSVGTICRMALSEHAGPKGQVFLARQDRPLWFSSVRDTFTWLLIESTPGAGYAAIWVNDMGKSPTWDKPATGAWVDAREAVFVVGSRQGAQMGGSELVPFGDKDKANSFAAEHGGTVMAFPQITRDVLAATEHQENSHD